MYIFSSIVFTTFFVTSQMFEFDKLNKKKNHLLCLNMCAIIYQDTLRADTGDNKRPPRLKINWIFSKKVVDP